MSAGEGDSGFVSGDSRDALLGSQAHMTLLGKGGAQSHRTSSGEPEYAGSTAVPRMFTVRQALHLTGSTHYNLLTGSATIPWLESLLCPDWYSDLG